jgi:hypothetical protein
VKHEVSAELSKELVKEVTKFPENERIRSQCFDVLLHCCCKECVSAVYVSLPTVFYFYETLITPLPRKVMADDKDQ